MDYKAGLKKSLKKHFGEGFIRFEELLQALPKTVPHTKLSKWSRTVNTGGTSVHLVGGSDNKLLRITISYSLQNSQNFLLQAELKKRRAFGNHERKFVTCVTREIGDAVDSMARNQSHLLLIGLQDLMDRAVSNFLRETTEINGPDFFAIIRYLKELAQQSCETKTITYGLLVSPRRESRSRVAKFPKDILEQKRFQALTDGYNSCTGAD